MRRRNDLAALIENGCDNCCCIGGNFSEDEVKILEKAQDIIYTCFDNDGAGNDDLDKLNSLFPEKRLMKIVFPNTYKDIDEYYTKGTGEVKHWNVLKEEAKEVFTDQYKTTHNGNVWSIGNRYKRLEYELKGKNDKGNIIGVASFYVGDKLTDREVDIPLIKCKAKMKPMNFFLSDEIEKYFNTNLEEKTLDELLAIYPYTSKKATMFDIIAKMIYDSNNNEDLIQKLKLALKSDDVIDTILKQVNDLQNAQVVSRISYIPKMRAGQYFNITNNDAYMYLTYVKKDGDTIKQLPYLLRNDKSLIRLDLLKRKDSQCLLLVDNKYELPFEINEALMDLEECSLTQEWAEKFMADQIPEEELMPINLVRKIEEYIRKFYYINDDKVYKMLALYTYATYYYELFDQMPYLYLNGEKGSGKSILDTTLYMLCFNAKMAIDISEASLFRIVSIEGGTMILDEMEYLNGSRNKTADSTMATILKGGYSRSGKIYRWNNEKNMKERYDPYGPKIISNIMGIEDIISDRCIQISTYRLKVTKETKMEDPKFYLAERRGEIKELTSKCCISALVHFQKMHKIFNSNLFETNNARLTQILTPILAVARLVDEPERQFLHQSRPELSSDALVGEYEKALMEFYEINIKNDKEEIDSSTPEGVIKAVVPEIAKELYGLVPQRDIEYTNPENHKYTEEIKYNKDEGWFIVNVMHFKCFLEEHLPGETAYARMIPRWIKTVFKFEKEDIRRRTVNIENEELIKEFKGNAKPKVNHYKFYFRDFIDELSDSFLNPEKAKNLKLDNSNIADGSIF